MQRHAVKNARVLYKHGVEELSQLFNVGLISNGSVESFASEGLVHIGKRV